MGAGSLEDVCTLLQDIGELVIGGDDWENGLCPKCGAGLKMKQCGPHCLGSMCSDCGGKELWDECPDCGWNIEDDGNG
jgi:hypothetical protein